MQYLYLLRFFLSITFVTLDLGATQKNYDLNREFDRLISGLNKLENTSINLFEKLGDSNSKLFRSYISETTEDAKELYSILKIAGDHSSQEYKNQIIADANFIETLNESKPNKLSNLEILEGAFNTKRDINSKLFSARQNLNNPLKDILVEVTTYKSGKPNWHFKIWYEDPITKEKKRFRRLSDNTGKSVQYIAPGFYKFWFVDSSNPNKISDIYEDIIGSTPSPQSFDLIMK
ncbi:hypothetical protein LC612_30295 [Nostoc sp. CHAB 5834]|nr:hypothetical protein [Nostoc sp. CHAB 5834]